jgi:hypothetical protein
MYSFVRVAEGETGRSVDMETRKEVLCMGCHER